ncbi:fluoride efflux transporter CrcB [Portibacter marinus]|uniref:fluoride efflux transporter CrcB n=1 Tax=Portibacter marinus TaxID=2898660 RepID=UPI001F44477C|nr:fluoride efflux transporter CrcB [Portibacter marinus]
MKAIILVFIGGGFGSILRYGIGQLMMGFSQKFPYGTLLVNVVACLILGYLIGITSKGMLSNEMKLLLMVGLCGGFSTFSTFSAESFQLYNTGAVWSALLYMACSFVICLFAIYLGLMMGKG